MLSKIGESVLESPDHHNGGDDGEPALELGEAEGGHRFAEA